MKKAIFILISSLSPAITILAQQGLSSLPPPPEVKGKISAVSIGLDVPVGEFAKTHFGGLGLSYAWSQHRFGKMTKPLKKRFGFTAKGGVDYYFGKQETVADYDYQYGGYLYLHAFAGAIYNAGKKTNLMLTTGPTLGIYKGGSDVGFGVSLAGSYYFGQRMGITSGIIYMKHAKANALWAPSIGVTRTF